MSDYERAYYGTPSLGTPWTDHGEPTSAAGLALRDRIHGFIRAAHPDTAGEPGETEEEAVARLNGEYGRLLAWRDRLIADGVDPADLEMPLHPDTAGEPGEPHPPLTGPGDPE